MKNIFYYVIGFFILFILLDKPEQKKIKKKKKVKPPIEQPIEEEKPLAWQDKVEWLEFPVQSNRVSGNSFYADVINHTPDYQRFSDKNTDVHENSHGISNYFLNKYSEGGTNPHNGFYIGDNKAVVLKEPKSRKSDCKEFLPSGLRQYRYNTYIAGQDAWDDRPLYIFDEWTAYLNGSRTSLELVKGDPTYMPKCVFYQKDGESVDAMLGSLEFFIYGTAIVMSIEKHDPSYFEQNPNFKPFYAWLSKKSLDVFNEGKTIDRFSGFGQDELYENLINGSDGKDMRDFLKKFFTPKWAKENLNIN